jgi:glutamate-ammonia-ligase adenylyltransferase
MPKTASLEIPVYDSAKADEIWAVLKEIAAARACDLPNRSTCDILFGHSPFMVSFAERAPDVVFEQLSYAPQQALELLLDELATPRPANEKIDDFSAFLRRCKSKLSFFVAAADVSEEWSLHQVTEALSKFADAVTKAALAYLFHDRMQKGELAWPNGEAEPASHKLVENSGYFVIGMGKLGAFELNYSSDIDLIVFYDGSKSNYTGRKSLTHCFVKITQDLVQLLDARTMHGYVFRTDLRLRPDPGATPVAIAVEAAESYYHSMAVNWERSAMIKARVIAGDAVSGDQFFKNMESWIWRRNMDFGALQDIAAIKNQINRHYEQEPGVGPGYNVKLGIGGIREIEFYAQVNQLLFAGRHPSLRTRGTIEALAELERLDLIPVKTRKGLEKAYNFLRIIEHRIQMVDDAQAHELPADDLAMQRLASFSGFNDVTSFQDTLAQHVEVVRDIYDSLLPDHQTENANIFSEKMLPETLDKLGFSDPSAGTEMIEAWRRGRYKSLRTERAKAMLEECLPKLLEAFAETESPNAALLRFDKFISQLPTGLQVFALFHTNPYLFKLIARVMGLAPALADTLAKKPELWDVVLEPSFFGPLGDHDELKAQLEERLSCARDFQDTLDFVRRFVAEQKFRLGVHLLLSIADVLEVGADLTRVADVTMQALVPRVCAEFERRHGRFEGGGIALIAMGKYGGRELTHTSDLDVVFLYDVEDMNSMSDGAKPLMPSQYFSRLGQNIITAITALTPEGRLFEVDTRLRPSGSQGPLVVTLQTFQEYYRQSAWTWEHMALTRARVILAPDGFTERVQQSITNVLVQERDRNSLVAAVHEMRGKLFEAFGADNMWAMKHTKGGLVDLEFICQYLILRCGFEHPDLFEPELTLAIERLAQYRILPEETCDSMEEAHVLMQKTQSLLRLSVGPAPNTSDDIPLGLKKTLVEATNSMNFKDLERRLAEAQSTIYNCYKELIEKPAIKLTKV